MLKKYFPLFLFLISILILIYTFYKSEIYYKGNLSDHYNFYYKFSFILMGLSIVTFFLNDKLITYLFIILISTSFSFYSYELFLIVKKKNIKNDRDEVYKSLTGKKFDHRDALTVYLDLKKKYKNVTVAIEPAKFFYDKSNAPYAEDIGDLFPFSGKSLSKTLHCNENGYYSIYDSDRYGFNNPNKEWDNVTIEYLLVGDSFTHGSCVNRPDDIASNLRKISKKPVLNLGMMGNGPLTEYATLKEYYKDKTKNILWMFFEGNDITGLQLELKNNILVKYLNDKNFKQNLKFKQKKIDNLKLRYIPNKNISIIINNPFLNFIKLTKVRYQIEVFKNAKKERDHIETMDFENTYDQFQKILQNVKEFSLNNNANFYLVYLPYSRKYSGQFDDEVYKNIKRIVNELDISFIDIDKELFKKTNNPLSLVPFEDHKNHFTSQAYKRIAEIIYQNTNN